MGVTMVAAVAAAAVLMDSVSGFVAIPSTAAGVVAVAALRSASLRRIQLRPRQSSWMCDTTSSATTRRDMVQVAGAAMAAATLSFVPTTTSAGAVTEDDRRGVENTTVRWKETVTLGTPDAPRKTADLYALDGVLWGTVSEEVRDTPEEIYDYFDYFARLPGLRLTEFNPVSERVYGDFATQAGTYTFAWLGADGATQTKRARFSFTFRRDPGSPTGWTIVEHHSSSMPTSPAELKHVRNGGTGVF